MLKLAAMEPSKWISVFFALSCATVTSAVTRPSWDIPFQLNRNYGLTAMNSDLNFPMSISPPPGGQLYSVPAQTFFSDKQLPSDSLYMQLNFQPNFSLSEFYFLTIRDPDGVLRFSLSMYKRQIYGVQLRYNLLDSGEGERVIDFPFPQSPTYWRLGVLIQEDSVKFFTNCPRLQSAPFHEEQGIRLLGRPLFRDGASAFLLNSGLPSNPAYFQGVLTEFTFHSGPDALSAPCKTTEFREESGESLYNFDPDFGNVIVNSADEVDFLTTTTSEPKTAFSSLPLAALSPSVFPEMDSSPSSMATASLPASVFDSITTMTEKTDFSHLVPMVDLSDMSVRLLNTTEKRLVPGARLENGRLLFENGTSISVGDMIGFLPAEDAISNVIVSVNLLRGTTTLLNLETSEPIMSRKCSDGIPLETIRNYGAGSSFEILLDNAIIQVDPYQGEWTVQNAETGEINLVQEVNNGVLYLANGEQVKMPTAGSEGQILAIEAVTGVVQTLKKETGEYLASFQPDSSLATVVEGEQALETEKRKNELISALPEKEEKRPYTDASTSPSDKEEGSFTVTSSTPLEEEERLWTQDSQPPSEKEEVSSTVTPSPLEEADGSFTVTLSPSVEEEERLWTQDSQPPSEKEVSSTVTPSPLEEADGSFTVTLSPPVEEEERLWTLTSLSLPENEEVSSAATLPPRLEEEKEPSFVTLPSLSLERMEGLSSVTLPSPMEREEGFSAVSPLPLLGEQKPSTDMKEEVPFIISSTLPSTGEGALSAVEKEIGDVKHSFEQSSSVDEVASSSFAIKEKETTEKQETAQSLGESRIEGDKFEETVLPLEVKKSTPSSEADEIFATPSSTKGKEVLTTEAAEMEDTEIKTEATIPCKDDETSCNRIIYDDDGSPTFVVTEPSPNMEEIESKDSLTHIYEERGDYGITTNPINTEDEVTVTVVEEMSNVSKVKVDEVVDGEEVTLVSHLSETHTATTPFPDEYSKSPVPLYQEEGKTMTAEERIKVDDFLEEGTSTISPEEREPHHEALIEFPPFQGPKEEEEENIPVSKSQGQKEQMNMTPSDEIGGEALHTTLSLETSTESSPLAELKPEEPTKDQSAQEILQPDCQCLERLLTPELLNKLRNGELDRPKPDDKVYDELFKTPAFLRVVREVINDYFDRPGVVERYKPNCLCPTNNDCQCPEPVTTPKPPYNISSSSRHILGALKDMSNGAIIMNNESVLAKVAYSLAPGSMVYLSAEDSFFLKTDEKKNIWRKIDMNTQSESVRIPAPQTTTTTTSIPALAENLVGKSLMLIAHNEPLNGELRFGAKITGGHSSAIFACQRAARRHNISHVFYPLMSTDMFNMDYVVPPMYRYDMPIVNRNGRMLFNDFMHLIKGDQPAMAPIYTFAGKELDSDPTVPCAWIGAKPIYLNGDYAYAARSKCRNWQTHSPMESGLAVHIPMNANATGFLDQSNLYEESCAKRCSVLCIQISPN